MAVDSVGQDSRGHVVDRQCKIHPLIRESVNDLRVVQVVRVAESERLVAALELAGQFPLCGPVTFTVRNVLCFSILQIDVHALSAISRVQHPDTVGGEDRSRAGSDEPRRWLH